MLTHVFRRLDKKLVILMKPFIDFLLQTDLLSIGVLYPVLFGYLTHLGQGQPTVLSQHRHHHVRRRHMLHFLLLIGLLIATDLDVDVWLFVVLMEEHCFGDFGRTYLLLGHYQLLKLERRPLRQGKVT